MESDLHREMEGTKQNTAMRNIKTGFKGNEVLRYWEVLLQIQDQEVQRPWGKSLECKAFEHHHRCCREQEIRSNGVYRTRGS